MIKEQKRAELLHVPIGDYLNAIDWPHLPQMGLCGGVSYYTTTDGNLRAIPVSSVLTR